MKSNPHSTVTSPTAAPDVVKESMRGRLPPGTLHVVDFGRQLVNTGDLDPVYVVLKHAEIPPAKLREWLLAYWCFYHVGTACRITDSTSYWGVMREAAANKTYPRSSERRHFRGAFAVKAVDKLSKVKVDDRFAELTDSKDGRSLPLSVVMKRVKSWYGFGDWIAFKVADMLERLNIQRVQFDDTDTFLFDSPREGADLVFEHYGPHTTVAADVDNIPEWALAYLHEHLGHLQAPPGKERTLNGQEYETILCKWKSHLSGHYTVGKDVQEVRHGLLRYATCKTSQLLLKAGAKGGLW